MLKMKDVFEHGVINDADSLMAKGYGELADFSGYKKEARYAAYAINNHDHLTEENARLREQLNSINEYLNKFSISSSATECSAEITRNWLENAKEMTLLKGDSNE